jgi:very-short-patch-repair endonuclease
MKHHFTSPEQKSFRRTLRKDQTFAEKVLWNYLRNRELLNTKFRRQYSVDEYVIDFYSPELNLAIELDGEIHELPEVKAKDFTRERHIKKYGIKILRITNEELLGSPDKAFKRITDKIISIKECK